MPYSYNDLVYNHAQHSWQYTVLKANGEPWCTSYPYSARSRAEAKAHADKAIEQLNIRWFGRVNWSSKKTQLYQHRR